MNRMWSVLCDDDMREWWCREYVHNNMAKFLFFWGFKIVGVISTYYNICLLMSELMKKTKELGFKKNKIIIIRKSKKYVNGT